MGELGWTAYEYNISSPKEFYAASEGYFSKERRQIELLRQIGYNLWQGNRTDKDRKIYIEDWLPFSTDTKKRSVKQPTAQEYNNIMKTLLK